MSKIIRSLGVLALALVAACAVSFAQGSGEATYNAKCKMCHGASGLGDTPAGKAMKAIPFTDPTLVHKSDADLIASTKNGKGKMPAYAGKLSDGEIKEVITYIRTLQKK